MIELLMTIILISIISIITVEYSKINLEEQRFLATVNEIKVIKKGLIGDENIKENQVRTQFGIVGDLGGIPSTLSSLLSKGAFPSYLYDANKLIHAGWNGPYVEVALSGQDLTKDEWGRNYSVDFVSDPVSITSLGADGAVGGVGVNQDISVSIPSTLFKAQVSGTINSAGSLYEDQAEIELYSSDGSGNITTLSTSITSADKGVFSFSNIPYGKRSVKIFIPSKAAVESTIGPYVIVVDRPKFKIPAYLTNISLEGNSESCKINADFAYASGGTLSNGNKRLTFLINVNRSISLLKMTPVWSSAVASLTDFSINGQSVTCSSGTYRTFPCNALRGEQITIVNSSGVALPFPLTAGNNYSFIINTSNSLTSGTTLLLHLVHSSGCGIIYIKI